MEQSPGRDPCYTLAPERGNESWTGFHTERCNVKAPAETQHSVIDAVREILVMRENPWQGMAASEQVRTAADPDSELMAQLRRGNQRAFESLLERYHGQLLRLAMLYVSNRTVAEDVVQETWMGVLDGLDRFEERSTLKTWIFRILVNRAKSRARKEARMIPFSALGEFGAEAEEPAVDPARFHGPDHERWPGHWAAPPQSWRESPEERLLTKEIRDHIDQSIAGLPATQREVITLRDVAGWTSAEVAEALSISDGNQRVLLHRARSKVRRALELYFEATY
jgi:RNA polymerase sigma-70 factor (ECF subfamily)